jgi:hypothetical protein
MSTSSKTKFYVYHTINTRPVERIEYVHDNMDDALITAEHLVRRSMLTPEKYPKPSSYRQRDTWSKIEIIVHGNGRRYAAWSMNQYVAPSANLSRYEGQRNPTLLARKAFGNLD